jgi:hypothetical protein
MIVLRIQPETVHRGTVVRISSPGGLPAGATVEWLVNGKEAQSGGGPTLDTAQLRKGDAIQARVAGAGGTVLSQVVTVRNSPPETRGVRFILGRKVGSTSAWKRKALTPTGTPSVRDRLAEERRACRVGERLEPAVKRGDKERNDYPRRGGTRKARRSPGKSWNAPPVIEGQEQFQVSGNVVTFHVSASDTDGDSPASHQEAPAGMRIDRATGWVRWETPQDGRKGPVRRHGVRRSGREATARFTVTIAEQPPSGAR